MAVPSSAPAFLPPATSAREDDGIWQPAPPRAAFRLPDPVAPNGAPLGEKPPSGGKTDGGPLPGTSASDAKSAAPQQPGTVEPGAIPPTLPGKGAAPATIPPIPPRIPPADGPAEPATPNTVPAPLPLPRRMADEATTHPVLPPAPPELLTPAYLPVAGHTFGSPALNLSRDYPSLAELCSGWLADRLWLPWSRRAINDVDWPYAYVQNEYLLWWMSPLRIPILATTNPDPNRFGYLNEPGTVPIVGPGNLIGSTRSGFRIRAGLWDADRSCAWDGSFFFLGRQTASVIIDSQHFPLITRPVFSPNPVPNGGGVIGETGEAVAVPGILRGQLRVDASSLLWGADTNLRCCLKTTDTGQVTGLIGYRYLNLSESLEILENILVIGPGGTRLFVPDPPGTVVFVRDRFATENRFHGGQIGLTWERRWGRWTVWGRATIAFGITEQELEIYGIQTRIRPGQAPVSYPGGLLAAASNLGTFHLDRFSVVPEVTMQVGYRLTPNWQLYVGYNFLYWTNVMRPGDQIDRVVDLTQVPNAPPVPFSGQFRPRPPFRQSDLLVSGLQFGVEWRW
ncbi:MAG: BBP7 family outer membrane beta-barrel protein [Gemmataceae bacterium]|nr:BBP7 family outer membrane beta-barrel protein [Gemmataceae bacterium]